MIVHFENSHRPTPFHEIFAEFGSIAQTESGLWTYAKFGSLTNAYPVCGRNMTQRPLGAACGRPNPTYDNPYEAYNTKYGAGIFPRGGGTECDIYKKNLSSKIFCPHPSNWVKECSLVKGKFIFFSNVVQCIMASFFSILFNIMSQST